MDTTTKKVFLNSFDEQSELDDLLGAKHRFEPLITTTELPDLSYHSNLPANSYDQQYAPAPSQGNYVQPDNSYNQPPVQNYVPTAQVASYNPTEFQPSNIYQPNQNNYVTPSSYNYPMNNNN